MMSKTFSVLAVIFSGVWGASQATANPSFCDAIAGNLVANCGFETGDFTGWTIGGNALNPGGNYYGVDFFDANSGLYGAYMSQDFVDAGTTPVTLSQTLATSVGQKYTVTFFLEQDTPPTPGYMHGFTALWGATTMLSLTPSIASPGTVGSFTEYTYTETATSASTVLSFSFENDDNYWSFDDTSVAAVAPEPSTGVLAGIALCAGFFFLARKKFAATLQKP